jgi:hypothetical protein
MLTFEYLIIKTVLRKKPNIISNYNNDSNINTYDAK